jgi:phytoene synthase
MRVTRSFWLIPDVIPLPERDDVSLLYCVCRLLDDDVDEAPDLEHARAALARWSAELRGQAEPRPLVAAFLAGAARTQLPMECLDHLLQGMKDDLEPVRIADDDALLRYCYRVAAAPGLLLARLVGIRGRDADARVIDYAIGLQISNVLFGVKGDARRDRVYLPATRLASAGLRAEDVLAAPDDARALSVMRGLAELADEYYRSALLGMARFRLRYRHGVILFARVYADLGRRAARGQRVLDPRTGVSWPVMARRLAELVATGWHPRTLGVWPSPPHDAALHRVIAGWPGTAPRAHQSW